MKKKITALLCLLLCLPLCACSVTLGGDRVMTDEQGNTIPLPPDGSRPNDLPPDVPGGGTAPEVTRADLSGFDLEFSDRDLDGAPSVSGACAVTFSASGVSVSGKGAAADGTAVTITAAGTYLLSGTCPNGKITVAAGDTDKVTLVLSSLSLTSADAPAICVESADKVFLTLAEGTQNTLSGTARSTAQAAESVPDGAVFSRADLTVNGSGALFVTGNAAHGIVSKDDLVITGGSITVKADKTALSGKDCVKIGGAPVLSLEAGSDGIRSDNSEDAARGFVYIKSGEIRVTAVGDGIQAETLLTLAGGTLNVTSGGGSANASHAGGSAAPGWGSWGSASGSTEASAKGLKAGSTLTVSGGTITVDSSDDAIHSNGTAELSGGTLTLSSGDDGIHADSQLAVRGGDISVLKSYEGLESSDILIEDGKIRVLASDDGINAAGGNDASAMGRPGAGGFARSSGSLTISGGYLFVNASGDGIDSNGTITVTGGVTLVCGPTDNGNSAFDCETSASVSGGVLIALGSSGMASGFTSAQNQGAILCNFATQSAGKTFAVLDEAGTLVASLTNPKQFSSAVITAPQIRTGGKYTLVCGAAISGADENGYACGTAVSGGTTLAAVEMTSALYGSGGMGPGGNVPGGPGGPGDPGQGRR